MATIRIDLAAENRASREVLRLRGEINNLGEQIARNNQRTAAGTAAEARQDRRNQSGTPSATGTSPCAATEKRYRTCGAPSRNRAAGKRPTANGLTLTCYGWTGNAAWGNRRAGCCQRTL